MGDDGFVVPNNFGEFFERFPHSVGLLRAAFRPGQDICAVRTVLRHRNELVSAASQHVQHMHKALTLGKPSDRRRARHIEFTTAKVCCPTASEASSCKAHPSIGSRTRGNPESARPA